MIYQILFFPLLSFIYLGSCLEVLVIHCYQTRKPVKRKLLLFRPQPFEPFEPGNWRHNAAERIVDIPFTPEEWLNDGNLCRLSQSKRLPMSRLRENLTYS